VEHSAEREEKLTFSEHLREIFRQPLQLAGEFLHKLGIKPNMITFTGVVGTLVGSVFVAFGQVPIGGIIIMVMSAVDVLDGAVARAGGEPEDFGAFVDSVSDRYGELIVFGSLLWYFVERGDFIAVGITFLAAVGSVMVSYTRARAQSLGFEAKVGLMTRTERVMVLGLSLLLNEPFWGVVIIAILGNLTAFQRIAYVRKQAYRLREEKGKHD
jgi:CDP-diacylglycerol--glycerol-3-phosphate 3-phosphatidyltransferase